MNVFDGLPGGDPEVIKALGVLQSAMQMGIELISACTFGDQKVTIIVSVPGKPTATIVMGEANLAHVVEGLSHIEARGTQFSTETGGRVQ